MVSGATFHQPSIFSVVFSDAAELAGCVLEKVKNIWSRYKVDEKLKELITMFIIFFVLISVVNIIFNYQTYQKNIKQGLLIKEFPKFGVSRLKKWIIVWNISLWFDAILYVIMVWIFKNFIGIGAGFALCLIYIFIMEVLIFPGIKMICKYKLGKK